MKIFKVLKNFYGFPVGVAEPAEGSRVLPSGGELPEKCKQWEEQSTGDNSDHLTRARCLDTLHCYMPQPPHYFIHLIIGWHEQVEPWG